MNFGEAIKCMKAGMKVTRDSWKGNFFNGKKQFIFIGKNKGMTTKALIPIPPSGDEFADCIMCYTKKRNFQPNWTPTQEDMLAEDWKTYPYQNESLIEEPKIPANMTVDEMVDLKNRIGWNIKFCGTGETIISEHMSYQQVTNLGEGMCSYAMKFSIPKITLGNLINASELFQDIVVNGIALETYVSKSPIDGMLYLITESALSEKEFYTIIGLKR